MPAPRTLLCYVCGRQFGASSLEIHIPQCKKKFEAQQALLPPEERQKVPKEPLAMSAAQGDGIRPSRGMDVDAYNEAAYHAMEQAMQACPHCGRTFAPGRLKIHLKSCSAESPAKRATQGVAPRNGASASTSVSARPMTAGVQPTTEPIHRRPKPKFSASEQPHDDSVPPNLHARPAAVTKKTLLVSTAAVRFQPPPPDDEPPEEATYNNTTMSVTETASAPAIDVAVLEALAAKSEKSIHKALDDLKALKALIATYKAGQN